MAAAYAALVSLMHTIDAIESHHSPPISLDKHQLQSLTEAATFLQGFIQGYSSCSDDDDEADPLEMHIAEAAHAAQDLIESYIADVIRPLTTSADSSLDSNGSNNVTEAMTQMSSSTTTTRVLSAALVSELLAVMQGFHARNPSEDAAGIGIESNIVDTVQMVAEHDHQQVVFTNEILVMMHAFLESYCSHVVANVDGANSSDLIAAYVIQTVLLDELKLIISTNIAHDQQSGSGSGSGYGSGSGSGAEVISCGEGESCIKLYEDLHQVIEEIDLIKKMAAKIAAVPKIHASLTTTSSSSSSMICNTTMLCPEDVLLEVMEHLTASRRDRHVVPIVGMGGIGKDDSGQILYGRPLIEEHFDVRAWATISQQCNTQGVLGELLSQATNRKVEELTEMPEQDLGLELHKFLFGKRFLIVMDDMWGIDVWDKIQRYFLQNNRGSRILVTTRLSQLSCRLHTGYSLEMKFLDELSSWEVFSKTVFGEGSCPLELEEIGKEIVRDCRGLPLSIVVVGGLLKKVERTQDCWGSIRNNLTSVVSLENEKHCLRLLRLSYDHLPVYLKLCFLYMGVFEEDYRIHVAALIKLWVSEGFVKPNKNGKSLETVAKGFFKDLVDRNLVLIDELGCTGNMKYCKIHDLVRDMCLREARKCGFYRVFGQDFSQATCSQRRRLMIGKQNEYDAAAALQPAPRTVTKLNEDKMQSKIPLLN